MKIIMMMVSLAAAMACGAEMSYMDMLKPACPRRCCYDGKEGSSVVSLNGERDLRYKQGVEEGTSWFLYGEPPFDIEKIKKWMK